MTITYFQGGPGDEPEPSAAAGANVREAGEAALRALPLERLVGNGMELADALALHRMAKDGVPWAQASIYLGNRNLVRAHRAEAGTSIPSARLFFRQAAACYRFGQSVLYFDTDEKVELYRRALDAFSAACRLDDPVTEKVEVEVDGSCLSGWLMRPSPARQCHVVMIFGGADGWREEYHSGAQALLSRGTGAFLVDGPGQGETRLIRKHYLLGPPELALAAVADALVDRGLATSVGVWGNSLGGNFAARIASVNSRISACCVNGGAAAPIEVLQRFPKFADRICAMMGRADHTAAHALLAELELRDMAHSIRCPLLVVHGGMDRIFSVENAMALYGGASSACKTAFLWKDGDHCIYKYSYEKHAVIADWFKSKLSSEFDDHASGSRIRSGPKNES